MQTSYAANHFDDVLFAIVTAYKPLVAVELGVLEGFSTAAIAEGLRDNSQRRGVHGKLTAYDLFEDYPYKHSSIEVVQKNIDDRDVDEFVELKKGDAYSVHEHYSDDSIDLLHVDISNTGETIKKIFELWNSKIRVGGVVCFEGGSAERDQIDWMRKYESAPLKPEFEQNEIIRKHYVFGTYLKFPSMTVCLKKR